MLPRKKVPHDKYCNAYFPNNCVYIYQCYKTIISIYGNFISPETISAYHCTLNIKFMQPFKPYI
jgi:hypothetical protein